MNLGPAELVIILFMGVLPLALTVWGLLDAAIRPEWAFVQAGQNKILWIILPGALYFVCLGWVAALFYLVSVRPKVRAAQLGPGYPGGPGGPGYPGGPPPTYYH